MPDCAIKKLTGIDSASLTKKPEPKPFLFDRLRRFCTPVTASVLLLAAFWPLASSRPPDSQQAAFFGQCAKSMLQYVAPSFFLRTGLLEWHSRKRCPHYKLASSKATAPKGCFPHCTTRPQHPQAASKVAFFCRSQSYSFGKCPARGFICRLARPHRGVVWCP